MQDYLQHVHQGDGRSFPGLAQDDYWSVFRWREEDDRATSGRNHADTSRSQARVHARLVRGPPT